MEPRALSHRLLLLALSIRCRLLLLPSPCTSAFFSARSPGSGCRANCCHSPRCLLFLALDLCRARRQPPLEPRAQSPAASPAPPAASPAIARTVLPPPRRRSRAPLRRPPRRPPRNRPPTCPSRLSHLYDGVVTPHRFPPSPTGPRPGSKPFRGTGGTPDADHRDFTAARGVDIEPTEGGKWSECEAGCCRSGCELTFCIAKYACLPSDRKNESGWIDCVRRTGQWCTTHWLSHPLFAHQMQRGPLF
jgi:hypothetical protein